MNRRLENRCRAKAKEDWNADKNLSFVQAAREVVLDFGACPPGPQGSISLFCFLVLMRHGPVFFISAWGIYGHIHEFLANTVPSLFTSLFQSFFCRSPDSSASYPYTRAPRDPEPKTVGPTLTPRSSP